LDRLNDSEYRHFSDNNAYYQERFGFPFIICARKTTKQGVLDAFEKRLKNSPEKKIYETLRQIYETLRQIHEIARLRLEDLVEG
jgi:2-oxo-4-hydroxy-4-carboxy-5-ureidoimidazoline decarboxylase